MNILVHPAPSFVTRQSRTKTLRESDGMIVTEANPSIFQAETTVEIDNLMSPAHTVFRDTHARSSGFTLRLSPRVQGFESFGELRQD